MLLGRIPAFIFLHVDKAAGSSIQEALLPYAESRINNKIRRKLVWLGKLNRFAGLYRVLAFPEHATAVAVRRCLPEAFYSTAFKFAFVRNPYDRLVSRYSYLLNNPTHRDHPRVRRMKDLAEFVRWEIRRNQQSQHDYVVDRRGRLIVDFVGRYERLEQDFDHVCGKLGVTATLPVTNVSGHRDYRTYYSERTREIVKERYAFDLELFGYGFDGLSTESLSPVSQSSSAQARIK
jgi:hypothetical protein